MSRIEKTIFISYRRTNLPWALAIFQNLKSEGYDVFFDYLSIPSGDFESIIVENIKGRAHFVVILTPSALERCNEPGDWLRREIETAIDEKRNIIPLMLESFDFGTPSTANALTGKLDKLKKYNGLRVHSEYFFEGMSRLREQFLNVSLDAVAHPISEIAKPVTEGHQIAASEAPQVEREQLTAQEWIERGHVFLINKNVDEAIRCFSEAIVLSPNDDFAFDGRGVAFAIKGELDKALTDLDEAIRINPTAKNFAGRGLVLIEKGDLDNALLETEKSIQLDPIYNFAHISRGNILEKLKRSNEAEASYRRAIELNPSDADAYSNLGLLLRDLKRNEEAEASYRKAIELNPSAATSYSNLGNTLCDLKRYEEAEAAYRKAITLNPSYTAYYNLGILLKTLERYEEAVTAYRKAIELNPSEATTYHSLGILLNTLERYEEAEAAYRKAIELDPSEATAYNNLGILLHINSEKYIEAEMVYRKAIELSPSESSAYFLLGVLLHNQLGRFLEADEFYKKAIELDPSNVDFYNGLVRLYRFKLDNRLEEALYLLERIIEINSEDFNSYLGVASIKKSLGESIEPSIVENARQYILEDDFYSMACLESICDNFDLAFEHLQRATQKEGFNPTWAWKDPDLQWIRDDPRFVEIVGPKPEK